MNISCLIGWHRSYTLRGHILSCDLCGFQRAEVYPWRVEDNRTEIARLRASWLRERANVEKRAERLRTGLVERLRRERKT